MPQLISVKGPHARGPSDNIRVQWNMGNNCNFSCEYCPAILHDGSKPWLPLQTYLQTIDRICQHYNAQNKAVHFELIGGEVTVMPGFEDIISKISSYRTQCVIFTNGSRTVNWWNKAKNYLNKVVITWHPDSMSKQHLIDVINAIKNHVYVDINIAGVGGRIVELGEVAEELRDLFRDCELNSYHSVSICVKTMYKKLLGANSKQETYWQYTPEEITVIQRPGIKAAPCAENTDQPDPTRWMTEFLYSDGSAVYVQNHQIIDRGLNQFRGMKCHLGLESININAAGDIYSSWCGAQHFGNISSMHSWNLPESETECPHDFCNNISDIAITKTA
jgi:organic radical activating enzyme